MQKTPDHQIDMVTASGHVVNFGNPELTTVDPEDIRQHTRNICRYNGALRWPLVKHLALCAKLADNQTAAHMKRYNSPEDPVERIIQAAFCASHDFHEIYCTDVVSGLKKYLPNYKEIEEIWEAYVHTQLGLPLEHANKKFVRHVDLRALVIEMTCLDHPAADIVAHRYGGLISGTENQVFKRINDMELDAAWKIVWQTFERGRTAHISRSGYTVELF